MKKELFDTVTVKVDSDTSYDMKLTYFLLTCSVSEEYSDLKVYGVEIDKEALTNGKEAGVEKKMIKNLFFKKTEAMAFLEKICRNRVTPIELKYVIKDHILEQINVISVKSQ